MTNSIFGLTDIWYQLSCLVTTLYLPQLNIVFASA